ncbi:MAG: hypothetical protein LBI05_04085 [Planctomycetaceae bacterium]|jgi:hypothetical protein|nr:hypothetical protein [Planctomycetaceae bacterium]
MLPKNCGKLLYNAVRETLEIMAFADVVPCSIKVAGEEFAQDDDFAVAFPIPGGNTDGWGDASPAQDPADAWGTVTPDVTIAPPEESWGDSPEPTGPSPATTDDWGTGNTSESADGAAWGRSQITDTSSLASSDPWGDASLADAVSDGQNRPKEADFDEMVSGQRDWCWACMKVNSPDVHSVWFVVPQSLARSLMENMYAGESAELDTPIVKDLIAELTNVLGGRLMLLLEEMGGKFTLTVPEIGFGMPDISQAYTAQGVVCKVVVDSEHPVITALCFNQGGVLAADG